MDYINLAKQYGLLYLDYANKFVSVEGFASYHNIPVKSAIRVITKGRAIHNDKFGHH